MDKTPTRIRTVVVTPQNSTAQRNEQTAAELGITTQKPKFPLYAQKDKRRESYSQLNQTWPTESPVKIDDLVAAGLVYTGVGDSVRCFYCGGELRNWEMGDDPMVEHGRWFPTCPHVILVKGKKFIERIADGLPPEEDCGSSQPRAEATNTSVSNDLMETDAVLAVKDMGYSNDLIVKGIEVLKHKNGLSQCRGTNLVMEFTAIELLSVIMDIEEDPESFRHYGVIVNSVNNVVNGIEYSEENDSLDFIVEENERLRNFLTCRRCGEEGADVIFLPCGHLTSCPQCAVIVEDCPLCRHTINGRLKAIRMDFAEASRQAVMCN